MLTIVARVPDALAIGFDEKHVGVIDAMTVGERSHPDIAYTDAFGDDIRRRMLPDPHPVDQPAFALGLFAMAQSIAALLRVTFPCKEFMGFKVCSLTDDIIIDEGICKYTGNYLDFNILTQVIFIGWQTQ